MKRKPIEQLIETVYMRDCDSFRVVFNHAMPRDKSSLRIASMHIEEQIFGEARHLLLLLRDGIDEIDAGLTGLIDDVATANRLRSAMNLIDQIGGAMK